MSQNSEIHKSNRHSDQTEVISYVKKATKQKCTHNMSSSQRRQFVQRQFELSLARLEHPPRHIIGHFGNKSSQAINYTGTDNKKIMN